MKLNFEPTRWNAGKYQVNGVGDGFYEFLVFGVPCYSYPDGWCHWPGLYRSKEAAMEGAQRHANAEITKKFVDAAEAL